MATPHRPFSRQVLFLASKGQEIEFFSLETAAQVRNDFLNHSLQQFGENLLGDTGRWERLLCEGAVILLAEFPLALLLEDNVQTHVGIVFGVRHLNYVEGLDFASERDIGIESISRVVIFDPTAGTLEFIGECPGYPFGNGGGRINRLALLRFTDCGFITKVFKSDN